MSILEINERMDGHSLSQTPDNTTYTRTFRVRTDVLTFDFSEIVGSPQIPVVGESHPSNRAAKVTSVEVEHVDEDQLIYEVAVTYDTNKEDNESFGGGFSDSISRSPDNFVDPTLEPPRISLSYQDYQEVEVAAYSRNITEDVRNWTTYEEGEGEFPVAGNFASDGIPQEPLANSVGEFVSEGLGVVRSYPVLSITENIRDINLNFFSFYHNTVNSAEIRVADFTLKPNEGLIKFAVSSEFDSRGDLYWKIVYTIRIDVRKRHHDVYVHTAFRERFENEVTEDWEIEPIYEEDGKTKIRKPQKVDVDGTLLGGTSYILLKKYPSSDWANIELPPSATDLVNKVEADEREDEEEEE